MKSIKGEVKNEIVIEKSRFITYLFNVDSSQKAKDLIQELRKAHSEANHVVYAYILENDSRSNDNNEPKGTAGLPTLEVLRKENLINVLAVTVRYFGGIKLGASGLLRAYTKGVSEALKLANFTTLKESISFELSITYKDSFFLEKHLDNLISVEKSYSDKVKYNITILKELYPNFKELFINFDDKYDLVLIKEEKLFVWKK